MQSVTVVSEGLECFGGQGYIEDTDLPRLLRDTQVTPIWEGTTNILSLDVLRAIRKSPLKSVASSDQQGFASVAGAAPKVLLNFRQDVLSRIAPAREKRSLQKEASKLGTAMDAVLSRWTGLDKSQQDMAARELAFSLARIYMDGVTVTLTCCVQEQTLKSSCQQLKISTWS
ncbi:acyl-CoA dehydrogenase family member 11 [Elysia marginata]|uniref:Acyl-CoA dehydrogenase family member 11 n=1 Tax=Elysia marginata TaxID=1093978 RepID=A0AAV4JLG0_9GAST|nr:acyl-CoA dehydrogenase family member 11 [Elysia marginata]